MGRNYRCTRFKELTEAGFQFIWAPLVENKTKMILYSTIPEIFIILLCAIIFVIMKVTDRTSPYEMNDNEIVYDENGLMLAYTVDELPLSIICHTLDGAYKYDTCLGIINDTEYEPFNIVVDQLISEVADGNSNQYIMYDTLEDATRRVFDLTGRTTIPEDCVGCKLPDDFGYFVIFTIDQTTGQPVWIIALQDVEAVRYIRSNSSYSTLRLVRDQTSYIAGSSRLTAYVHDTVGRMTMSTITPTLEPIITDPLTSINYGVVSIAADTPTTPVNFPFSIVLMIPLLIAAVTSSSAFSYECSITRCVLQAGMHPLPLLLVGLSLILFHTVLILATTFLAWGIFENTFGIMYNGEDFTFGVGIFLILVVSLGFFIESAVIFVLVPRRVPAIVIVVCISMLGQGMMMLMQLQKSSWPYFVISALIPSSVGSIAPNAISRFRSLALSSSLGPTFPEIIKPQDWRVGLSDILSPDYPNSYITEELLQQTSTQHAVVIRNFAYIITTALISIGVQVLLLYCGYAIRPAEIGGPYKLRRLFMRIPRCKTLRKILDEKYGEIENLAKEQENESNAKQGNERDDKYLNQSQEDGEEKTEEIIRVKRTRENNETSRDNKVLNGIDSSNTKEYDVLDHVIQQIGGNYTINKKRKFIFKKKYNDTLEYENKDRKYHNSSYLNEFGHSNENSDESVKNGDEYSNTSPEKHTHIRKHIFFENLSQKIRERKYSRRGMSVPISYRKNIKESNEFNSERINFKNRKSMAIDKIYDNNTSSGEIFTNNEENKQPCSPFTMLLSPNNHSEDQLSPPAYHETVVLSGMGISKEYRVSRREGKRLVDIERGRIKLKHKNPKRYVFSAVDDVSISFYKGITTGVIGENGAGKTTLLRMIMGTESLTKGKIEILGEIYGDDNKTGPLDILPLIGYVPQHDILGKFTCKLHCIIMARCRGLKKKEATAAAVEALELVGLQGKANCIATTLSGGQKRRLMVAMALCGGPPLLILDEPEAGLSVDAKEELDESIRRVKTSDVSIVMTEHDMEQIEELCDDVIVLKGGKIISKGTPLELKDEHAGYTLRVSFVSADEERSNELLNALNTYTETTIKHADGKDVTYSLSSDAAICIEDIAKTVEVTEGVLSYGIRTTTLGDAIRDIIGENEEIQPPPMNIEHSDSKYGCILNMILRKSVWSLLRNKISLKCLADIFVVFLMCGTFSIFIPDLTRFLLDTGGYVSVNNDAAVALAASQVRWTGDSGNIMVNWPDSIEFPIEELNAQLRDGTTPIIVFNSPENATIYSPPLSVTPTLLHHAIALNLEGIRMGIPPTMYSSGGSLRSFTIDEVYSTLPLLSWVIPLFAVLCSLTVASLSVVIPYFMVSERTNGFEGLIMLTGRHRGMNILSWTICAIIPYSIINFGIVFLVSMIIAWRISSENLNIDFDQYVSYAAIAGGCASITQFSWSFLGIWLSYKYKSVNTVLHVSPHMLWLMLIPYLIFAAFLSLGTSHMSPYEANNFWGIFQWIFGIFPFSCCEVLLTNLLFFGFIPSVFKLNTTQAFIIFGINIFIAILLFCIVFVRDSIEEGYGSCIPTFLKKIICLGKEETLDVAQPTNKDREKRGYSSFKLPSEEEYKHPKEDENVGIERIHVRKLIKGNIYDKEDENIDSNSINIDETVINNINNEDNIIINKTKSSNDTELHVEKLEKRGQAQENTSYTDQKINNSSTGICDGKKVIFTDNSLDKGYTESNKDIEHGDYNSNIEVNASRHSTSRSKLMENEVLQKYAAIFCKCRREFKIKLPDKTSGVIAAVRCLDLSVHKGECLGLVGENGAGKSTALSMAIGNISPSFGVAQLLVRRVGYVPQSNAHCPWLTVKQHVKLFAKLGGVKIDDAFKIASFVGLNKHMAKRPSQLSGGYKRRLSLAIALITSTEMLVADEVAAGVDESARYSILALMDSLKDAGCSVIMTSHDMDAVDRITNRVAVLVKGRLRALDTPEKLKQMYGGGLMVSMQLRKTDSNKAKEWLSSAVGCNIEVIETVMTRGEEVKFMIPSSVNCGMVKIMSLLSPAKRPPWITRTDVNQASLQNAFLQFETEAKELGLDNVVPLVEQGGKNEEKDENDNCINREKKNNGDSNGIGELTEAGSNSKDGDDGKIFDDSTNEITQIQNATSSSDKNSIILEGETPNAKEIELDQEVRVNVYNKIKKNVTTQDIIRDKLKLCKRGEECEDTQNYNFEDILINDGFRISMKNKESEKEDFEPNKSSPSFNPSPRAIRLPIISPTLTTLTTMNTAQPSTPQPFHPESNISNLGSSTQALPLTPTSDASCPKQAKE